MLDFDTLGTLYGLILRVWKIKNAPQSSENMICHWEWGTVIFLPYAWGITIQPISIQMRLNTVILHYFSVGYYCEIEEQT